MKGWEFKNTHVPLELIEKADPELKPGWVTLDIKATGLCHSDVGALEDEGWLELITTRPVIMGHEFAGIVTGVGEGVTNVKVGDKVGVCPITEAGSPGYQFDGGYADKAVVPASCLVPIPEGVSFAQGAAATDAGMTSFHAMFVTGGAKAGMKVGVIGIGGLGGIAGRAAVIEGCEVYGVDVSPAARDYGRELGMKDVFENVSDLAAIAPDLIVDYAGFGTTTADAIETVAVGGTVVQVGMGRLEATINTRSLIVKAVRLLGSVGGDNGDIAKCYEMMASGELDPLITEISFDEIAEGLERLHQGGVKGRLVAVL